MQYYTGCFLGGAIGDAIGFHNGEWEFNKNSRSIIDMCRTRYECPAKMNLSKLLISDDTIMHEATALALLRGDPFAKTVADEYVKCWDKMTPDRGAGITCTKAIEKIKKTGKCFAGEYNESGGGNGASMRSMCIGLMFSGISNRCGLITKSIVSSIVTHHNAIAYLGSIVSAIFTAFAIEKIRVENWGFLFLELFLLIRKFVDKKNPTTKELDDIEKFYNKFKSYLVSRNIDKLDSNVVFPKDYDNIDVRDDIFKKWSFSGWAGASGDDSVMIAYDSLLYAKNDWNKLLETACLHAGDSDSTGTIAGAWFGGLYGELLIPDKQKRTVENCNFLRSLATQIYDKSRKNIESV